MVSGVFNVYVQKEKDKTEGELEMRREKKIKKKI